VSANWRRLAVAFLLLGGAYFASLRWFECAFALGGRFSPDLARVCAFGTGNPAFDAQAPGPLWPRLAIAVAYLAAAVWLLVSKRVRFV